jgi:hypothetical protein
MELRNRHRQLFQRTRRRKPWRGRATAANAQEPAAATSEVMIANSLPAEEFHTLKYNVSQMLLAPALLREKGHLVPESLRKDQNKLIFHYDQWLEEYDRIRIRKTTNPEEPFVFVYSFPQESERHFRERMAQVEAKLGNEARCK